MTIHNKLLMFFVSMFGFFSVFAFFSPANAAEKERVRCYFEENTVEQKCWDATDPSNYCMGKRYCSFFVYGNNGDTATVENSCGDTQSITIDADDEKFTSNCNPNSTPEPQNSTPSPTPLMCPVMDLAQAPEGCYYNYSGSTYTNEGCEVPQYDLICSTPTITPTPFPTLIGEPVAYNCEVYYDGCNTCSRSEPGGQMMCTEMACIQNETSYCKQYFSYMTPTPIPTYTPPIYTPNPYQPTEQEVINFVESIGMYSCYNDNWDWETNMDKQVRDVLACGEYYQVTPPFGLADAPNDLYDIYGNYITSCGGYMPYEMYQQQDPRCFIDCTDTQINACRSYEPSSFPTPIPTYTPSPLSVFESLVNYSTEESPEGNKGSISIWNDILMFMLSDLPNAEQFTVLFEIYKNEQSYPIYSGYETVGYANAQIELWHSFSMSSGEIDRRISPEFTEGENYRYEITFDPFNQIWDLPQEDKTVIFEEYVYEIGKPESFGCTMQYDPVCGIPTDQYCYTDVNGMTMCQGVSMDMYGYPTPPMPQTYSNMCHLGLNNAEFLYYGECDEEPIYPQDTLTFSESKRGVDIFGQITGGINASDNQKDFRYGEDVWFDTALDSWNELEFYAMLQVLPSGWEITSPLPQGCVQSFKENKVNVKCIDTDLIYSASPYYQTQRRERIFTKTFAIPDMSEKAIVTRTNTYFTVE